MKMMYEESCPKSIAPRALLVVVGLIVVLSAFAREPPAIRVVSSRADTVSGNDVLVEVSPLGEFEWAAWLNGTNVTGEFHAVTGSDKPLALLTGLKLGPNTL